MCDSRPEYLVTVMTRVVFLRCYHHLGFHEWIYCCVKLDFVNLPYFFCPFTCSWGKCIPKVIHGWLLNPALWTQRYFSRCCNWWLKNADERRLSTVPWAFSCPLSLIDPAGLFLLIIIAYLSLQGLFPNFRSLQQSVANNGWRFFNRSYRSRFPSGELRGV